MAGARSARLAVIVLVSGLPRGSSDSTGCVGTDSAECLPAFGDEDAALDLLQRRGVRDHRVVVEADEASTASELVSDEALSEEKRGMACFSGQQSIDEYMACLRSVPIQPARRDCALDIIFGQLRSLYTYSSLVMDSHDTDAELAPGFDFKVYKSDLGDEIDKMEADMRKETSAGILSLKLAKMFGKFKDAHTALYINPLVRTKIEPPFTINMTMKPNSGDMQVMVVECKDWAPKELEGKVISSINGGSVVDYFVEVASLSPYDKSPGTRLNRYLRTQRLRSVPPKDNGVFHVTTEDGSTHKVAWKATIPENACGLGDDYRLCNKDEILDGNCTNATEVLEKCFSHNPTFDNMVDFFHTLGREVRCTVGGTAASKAVEPGAFQAKQVENGMARLRPWDAPDPAPGETIEEPLVSEEALEAEEYIEDSDDGMDSDDGDDDQASGGPSSNLTAAQQFEKIEVVMTVEKSCYVFKVDLGGGSYASVLKLVSFGLFSDIKPCAAAAVDLAAEVSDGKLIIDVIGNGGGYVSAGYLLNHYLYARMPGSTMKGSYESCEWYDLPQNRELTWFVKLSEQGLAKLSEQAEPRQFISSLIARMDKGVEAFGQDPDYFGRNRKAGLLNESASCLRILLDKFTDPEVPDKASEEWSVFSSLYRQCVNISEPLGASRGLSIMSYSPSNMFPYENSPPTWDYYLNPVTKVRGGKSRNFSRMTFLGGSCKGYAATYPEMYGRTNLTDMEWPQPPQTKLKHITYLSDGTCGSTCSVSSSSAYLDGLVTFVTYGGIKGEPMDITSFNGGNVGTYQRQTGPSLCKSALDSVVDASVFYPKSEPPNWPFLPIPLNLYMVRFAQRAEYPRALGPKALPREWYLIPASYHLDVWTTHSFTVYEQLEEPALLTLHDLYMQTAAKAPKPLRRNGK